LEYLEAARVEVAAGVEEVVELLLLEPKVVEWAHLLAP